MTVSLRQGRPTRHDGVWLRQAGGENAVVDPASQSVHMLNETALAIWHLCDGRTTPEEMIDAICEVTHLPVDVVSEDVARVLGEFDDARLLVWVD